MNEEDIVYRLQKRAEIRRQIPGRKSVEEGTADRIADILEEAATEIEESATEIKRLKDVIQNLQDVLQLQDLILFK